MSAAEPVRASVWDALTAHEREMGRVGFDLRPVPLPPDTLRPPPTPLPGRGRLVRG